MDLLDGCRRAPQIRPSMTTPDSSVVSEATSLGRSASDIDPFAIGSFDLVRKFVEQVLAKDASAVLGVGRSSRNVIDWEALEASVAGCRSFEQAIGRAIVIADQMCRSVLHGAHAGDACASLKTEDPFFAFSLADVVPDFGDESRFRTRVVRKAARFLKTACGQDQRRHRPAGSRCPRHLDMTEGRAS